MKKPIEKVDPVEKHFLKQAAKATKLSTVRACIEVGGCQIQAFVAETQLQKQAGLSVLAALGNYEGMYFPFKERQSVTFHMGGVKFPIDIIFLTKDDEHNYMKVARIISDVEPDDKESWTEEADAVLEVGGGLCASHGIGIGDACKIKYSVSETYAGSVSTL
ncbi:MAG: DUF192 domain-containing protein [Candidatus Paceibacterota bacterium]